MSKIVHFEIESSNFDASKDFYAACFGWTYELYEQLDYHQIDTGKDASGSIRGLSNERSFDQKIILTINVEDLDEKLVQIANHGGSIVMPPQEIPGVGRLAYFKDPLDTIMGLMQPIVYKEENATKEI